LTSGIELEAGLDCNTALSSWLFSSHGLHGGNDEVSSLTYWMRRNLHVANHKKMLKNKKTKKSRKTLAMQVELHAF